MHSKQPKSIPGTLICLQKLGILLQGPAGIGKSDTALTLLKNGYQLVADDAVELEYTHNKLIGKSALSNAKFIFIHGIGIIDVVATFGNQQSRESSSIDLLIELSNETPQDYNTDQFQSVSFYGYTLAKLIIPCAKSRNCGTIIETAVSCFLLRKKGYNAAHMFEELLRKVME